jgi:hypothetical protein
MTHNVLCCSAGILADNSRKILIFMPVNKETLLLIINLLQFFFRGNIIQTDRLEFIIKIP